MVLNGALGTIDPARGREKAAGALPAPTADPGMAGRLAMLRSNVNVTPSFACVSGASVHS
jgi:hypothetical protein